MIMPRIMEPPCEWEHLNLGNTIALLTLQVKFDSQGRFPMCSPAVGWLTPLRGAGFFQGEKDLPIEQFVAHFAVE